MTTNEKIKPLKPIPRWGAEKLLPGIKRAEGTVHKMLRIVSGDMDGLKKCLKQTKTTMDKKKTTQDDTNSVLGIAHARSAHLMLKKRINSKTW